MLSRCIFAAAALFLAGCSAGDSPPGSAQLPSPGDATPAASSGQPAQMAAAGCTKIGTYESIAVYRAPSGIVSFRANVDVNTDGALESYKIDDLGNFDSGRLNTRSALNTICNGVNIRSASNQLVFSAGQCKKLIPEFERIRNFGWIKPGENYVQFYAIALKPGTEKPGKSKGEPCVKDGFYVSQVAAPIDKSKHVCDPARWVDALRIPAIVLPLDDKMKATGVKLHDVAAVRLPNGNQWFGAIVGDTNPSKIGEGTVKLLMQLSGQSAIPGNYLETVDMALPSADYVVFPGSAASIPNLSNGSSAKIAERAQALVQQHGLEGAAICR